MKAEFIRNAAGLVLAAALAIPAAAQQPPAAAPAAPAPPPGPPVGDVAPDFEFAGITRYGALRDKQKLSDLRGTTVVLAFFPKARTRG